MRQSQFLQPPPGIDHSHLEKTTSATRLGRCSFKKGGLSNCDNLRGIALLDVVGIAVATILQERLQILAEQELPESQCGFCKGKSCTDMIFVVRQLMEKTWEHKTKSFDLRKAYDSVPRRGMWLALKKLGVPEKTVNLISGFHNNIKPRLDWMANSLRTSMLKMD